MDWMRAFGDPATLDPQANINYSPSKDTDALEPNWSAGIGEGLIKALPSAYYQSLSAFNDLASAVPYNEDLAAQEDPLSDLPPQTQTDREKIQARMDADAKFARLKVKNEWTPNPETTGTAGQIVHGLTSSLAKAIGYSFAGGPFVGGAMYGADIGAYEAGKLRDQGVDASTAKLSGFASGATNAVGLALPAALGTNYFKSALFGAAVNPLTDVSERGAINFILDNANYTEISKEYDPFDPTMLTTSALLGGAFGALGARANRVKVEQLAKDIKEHAPIAQAEQEPRLKQDVLDSIQNRDRTGKESKLQMASIARSPDFNRLRESRNLNEGAPVIAYVPESANIVYGKRVEVSDSEGNRYPMRYAVIEANEVLTSNSVDGSANPQFTDVNTDKARAIAGNGRVAGLQGAYRDVHATDYRAELTQDSKQFGISRGRVKKMENPILVRVMDDSDVTVGIGEKSNRSGIAKLTPEEQAAQDARNVDLDEVEFRADGDITVQSMDYFVARTPDKEGLVDHQGNTIYDQVRNRMRAAIFASAFQDTRLINRFISGTQKEKQILDVLMNAAPEIVRLRRMGADYDFSEDVVNAVADIFQTRQETKGKIQGEQTQSLFEGTEAQQYFKDILLSDDPGKINKVLERIREVVHAEGQENFFGDKITAQDIFNFVRDEFGAFKRVVDSITQEDVDAAMVLKSANTIQGDQPSGKNGNLNKSIEAEKTAREQIDNGETVSVNTDGVDPEKLDKDVSNFVTRFVKELVGAGADKKIAEMDARVIGAFYRSFGARSGRNIEQEYGVKVRAGGDADSEAGYLQSAYHGSPHVFDKFSTDFIGSGEGAQAHGWGLYFAKNKKVAEDYRKTLTGKKLIDELESKYYLYDSEDWRDFDYQVKNNEIELPEKYRKVWNAFREEQNLGYSTFTEALYAYTRNPKDFEPTKGIDEALNNYDGRLFELDIPEEALMLDEQLPLVKQPTQVQEGIKSILREFSPNERIDIENLPPTNGKGLIKILEMTGKELGESDPRRWASMKLNQHGIKGIAYDGKRDGRCYVVFDDKAVEVIDYFQTPKDGGGPRGIYTPGERVITLMYSADESTFVHEAGHYFLDVLTDVGKRSDVPEQIRNDIQTLMDWFGVKDLKEWDSLSIDEKRAHHEQFSRGFEQYLRDGEAPSLNLKAVFDAFKNWLRSIYKSSQELNIEISPEVRGVYDRLLATDEEIRAKQEADQPSMFNFDEAPQRTPQEAVTQLIEEAPIPDEAKTIVKRTLGIEDQKTQESAKKGIPNDNEFIDQSIESAVQRDPNATVIDENGNEISIKEFLANSQKELEDDMKFADGMSKAAECMWQNGAFDFL